MYDVAPYNINLKVHTHSVGKFITQEQIYSTFPGKTYTGFTKTLETIPRI